MGLSAWDGWSHCGVEAVTPQQFQISAWVLPENSSGRTEGLAAAHSYSTRRVKAVSRLQLLISARRGGSRTSPGRDANPLGIIFSEIPMKLKKF